MHAFETSHPFNSTKMHLSSSKTINPLSHLFISSVINSLYDKLVEVDNE